MNCRCLLKIYISKKGGLLGQNLVFVLFYNMEFCSCFVLFNEVHCIRVLWGFYGNVEHKPYYASRIFKFAATC